MAETGVEKVQAGSKEMENLKKLIGAPRKFKITYVEDKIVKGEDGEEEMQQDHKTVTLFLTQIRTGRIPMLVNAAGSLMPMFTQGARDQINLPTLFAFHSNEMLDMLAVLYNTDRSLFDKFELNDTVLLMGEALEMNLDFFVQRVLPLLSGGLGNLLARLQTQKDGALKLAGKMPQPS